MEIDVVKILDEITKEGASDIFIVAGKTLCYKNKQTFYNYTDSVLTPQDTKEFATQIYTLTKSRRIEDFLLSGDDDFSVSIKNVARFRVNFYKQRGSVAGVIRIIKFELPDPKVLNIPDAVLSQVEREKGLVLVTGSAGCGKSTTLACMIDRINSTREDHIVTLEDPIEFLHPHKKSIISQREIGLDTKSYLTGLKSILRQSPNVILIGELRDAETIDIAMTASETGHLVISTLHTIGAANTIDRIIDLFDASRQSQARLELSMVLSCVISQQLVLTKDNSIKPVFEIMSANTAIKNMIREAKTHQIDSVIQTSAKEGMVSMDNSLFEMYLKDEIDEDTLLEKSQNPDMIRKKLKFAK